MEMEKRAFSFETREENDTLELVGTPIVFNRKCDLGWCDEIIERTALDGCELKDMVFLINHNFDMIPLARYTGDNNRSTMKITIDDLGMHIVVSLDTENTEARNLYNAVKRGDLKGMSFGFRIKDLRYENIESEHPTRYITALEQVFEVSACTIPAYADTTLSARSKAEFQDLQKNLNDAKLELLKNMMKRG